MLRNNRWQLSWGGWCDWQWRPSYHPLLEVEGGVVVVLRGIMLHIIIGIILHWRWQEGYGYLLKKRNGQVQKGYSRMEHGQIKTAASLMCQKSYREPGSGCCNRAIGHASPPAAWWPDPLPISRLWVVKLVSPHTSSESRWERYHNYTPSTTTKENFTCNGLTTPSSCILPTLLTADWCTCRSGTCNTKTTIAIHIKSAMVAEHEGKNKGQRLAMLLVDMARHKCIHPDQISKSSIPLAWNKNISYLLIAWSWLNMRVIQMI